MSVDPLIWITNAVKAVAKDNRRSRQRTAEMGTDLLVIADGLGTGLPGIGGRYRNPAK